MFRMNSSFDPDRQQSAAFLWLCLPMGLYLGLAASLIGFREFLAYPVAAVLPFDGLLLFVIRRRLQRLSQVCDPSSHRE